MWIILEWNGFANSVNAVLDENGDVMKFDTQAAAQAWARGNLAFQWRTVELIHGV